MKTSSSNKNILMPQTTYVACKNMPVWCGTLHIRNRLHVAMHLFSNRSHVTSICGKNKKVT